MTPYKRTIKYLFSLEGLGIRPGLERMTALLSALGDPHLSYPAVHVAGTNGKGSTSAILSSILAEAGFRTGLYTSPHLVRLNERIRISGRPVSDNAVVEAAKAVKRASRRVERSAGQPTFFEFTTAMAFLLFRERKVGVAVIETGMGGRLDATNVITPLVSIITNIGIDHTEHLGATLKEIASEKAGIIKRGVPVITGEEGKAPIRVIRTASRRMRAPLYRLGADFSFRPKGAGVSPPFDFIGIDSRLPGLTTNLIGRHQLKNASLAVTAAEVLGRIGFVIPEKALRRGLRRVVWPGRLEVVRRKPLVIIDSAHNPDGAAVLKEALLNLRYKRLILVIGMMADKDISGVFSRLVPLSSLVILTSARTTRAASPALLMQKLSGYGVKKAASQGVAGAVDLALKEAGPDDCVCVAGSVYVAGEARERLLKKRRP